MPAKNPPQSLAQMLEAEQSRRAGSKLYKAESAAFVDGQIADMVQQTAQELKQTAQMEPISLSNIDSVVSATLDYIHACADASTIPSIVGLSRALGHTRQSLYDCIARNSPKAAARWLETCRDAFAELLGNSALRNGTNTITSIFLLKALYNYRETNEFIIQSGQAQQMDDADREAMAEQIMLKYSDIPED